MPDVCAAAAPPRRQPRRRRSVAAAPCHNADIVHLPPRPSFPKQPFLPQNSIIYLFFVDIKTANRFLASNYSLECGSKFRKSIFFKAYVFIISTNG